MDYAAAVVELFQSSHAKFVTERKRLAADVRAAGNKLGAARLVAIQRPPISAWVVNQLYWQARDQMDAMFASADRLRAGDLAASQEHRESIAHLRERAALLLEAGGHGAAEGTLRKVNVTLTALAAIGGWAPDQPGCLADDRDPPGFEAFAAMTTAQTQPMKPIGGAIATVVKPLEPIVKDEDHEAALRSLDGEEDDEEEEGEEEEAEAVADEEEPPAEPVMTEQQRKYAAVQAIVEKQRAAAAKSAAVAAAAVAKRKAEAGEIDPATASAQPAAVAAVLAEDDAVAAEQARKFAAAQAVVQKQREQMAKGKASAAAAIAARNGAPPPPLTESPRVEMQRKAAAIDQAKQTAKLETLKPAPAAAPPDRDRRKDAERERLAIEVKRARSEVHARERAVERLRTQLENAEIAVATATATLTAYETKLRAIDPTYEPPPHEPVDLDDEDE